jgi:1,4-alpha-glucan branching enzyme
MLTFIRHDRESGSHVLAVLNLTPNPLANYRIGLPKPGRWREVLNSDAAIYAGSNQGNPLGVSAEDYAVQNQRYSAMFTLPPLSVSVFKAERQSIGSPANDLKLGQIGFRTERIWIGPALRGVN